VVKQPDIPAGSEAGEEPARPAADPLDSPGTNGSGWAAPDVPAVPGWAAPDRFATYRPEWDAAAPPAAAPYPSAPPGHGPSVRLWLTAAVALLGAAGLAIALLGVAGQLLPRRFSAAQQQQIMSWQVASRWRTWPAGKIFPASVSYQLPWSLFGANSGLTLSARRVGIAPQARCAAAIDAALARSLARRGCQAVLRATYTDSTGSFVVTLGIAVMRGTAPATASLPAGHGVRPVPFPRTLAARFGSRQRQLSGAVGYGPYLVLYATGYTDGRQRDRVSSNPYADSEMKDLGAGVARSIGSGLGARPPLPRCPGAPGC
jgi:hypothetical protein